MCVKESLHSCPVSHKDHFEMAIKKKIIKYKVDTYCYGACSQSPCGKRGVCVQLGPLPDDYRCDCKQGFMGRNCEDGKLPFITQLFKINCQSLEAVSRCRDPQLQVTDNFVYLYNLGHIISQCHGFKTYVNRHAKRVIKSKF